MATKKAPAKRAPKKTKVETPEFEEKVCEELPVTLPEDELARISHDAANRNAEVNKMKADFKEVKRGWNQKIKEAEASLNEQLETVRTGMEWQEVEAMKKVFKRKVEYWSLDGETLYHERPVEDADRQMRLPMAKQKQAEEVVTDTDDGDEVEQVFGT